MEIFLSNGILNRRRKLVLNERYIEYEAGNEIGKEYTQMSLSDIAAVRYGYENLVVYRFRIGTKFQIELKDQNDQQLVIKFRSYLFNSDETSQLYLSILDQLWALNLEQKVEYWLEQWQAGQTISIGNVNVASEGIYLEKNTQFIPWSTCSLMESLHYFSINSKTDPKAYTNIYYLKEWNGVVLFSLLEMILKNKMNNKIGIKH